MLKKLRPRLTYANVVSSLCLFIVLSGGTAYATHLVVDGTDVVDESLTGADIQGTAATASSPAVNGTLTGADVKNASITSYDIALNTIGGGRVINNSLTGDDINESTLGQVPSAASAAVSGREIAMSDLVTNYAGQQNGGDVDCPTGKAATGGGVYAHRAGVGQNLNSSYPQGRGWSADVNNETSTDSTFRVYAVCVDVPATAAARSTPEPPDAKQALGGSG